MTIAEAVAWLGMQRHEEGGWYCPIPQDAREADRGCESAASNWGDDREAIGQSNGRASSGAIYYALLSDETADFHVIDCDEYWCHHAGDVLQLWMVDPSGDLSIRTLGPAGEGEPLVLIPAGTVFAARHFPNDSEGTLVSCITVPKFDYSGWRLYSKKEVCVLCPEAKGFWE